VVEDLEWLDLGVRCVFSWLSSSLMELYWLTVGMTSNLCELTGCGCIAVWRDAQLERALSLVKPGIVDMVLWGTRGEGRDGPLSMRDGRMMWSNDESIAVIATVNSASVYVLDDYVRR
jgi:hypothetical protein